ncbi:MAG: alpha/beta fold hydrolase [Egibacteraceae bacterium]
MSSIEIAGITLSYQEYGQAGPAMVILHGGSGRAATARPLAERLAKTMRVWAPDLPGHGDTSPTPGEYQLRAVAWRVAALMERVIGEPAVVYGHSYGGHVAMMLAFLRPDLLSGLVVGDAPLTLARHRAQMEKDGPMVERFRDLASTEPGALEELPVPSPSGALAPAGEVYGRGHPWFAGMAGNLHPHDPDFLTAVIDRFDDTYLGLGPDLLGSAPGPVLRLQADPVAGGLLTDEESRQHATPSPECASSACGG